MSVYVRSAVDSSDADLLNRYLVFAEQQYLQQLPAAAGTDWLVGRSAVKQAASELSNTKQPARQLRIDYHPSGQPYLKSQSGSSLACQNPPHISISHRGGVGVGAASGCPVGVDVEMLQNRNLQMLTYISSSPEREAVNQIFTCPNRQITFLWVIKEAVMKADGCGLSLAPAQVFVQSVFPYGKGYRVTVSAPLRIPHWCVSVRISEADIFYAVAQPKHDNKAINWNISL